MPLGKKKQTKTVFSFPPSVSNRTTGLPCGFSCSVCYFLDATGKLPYYASFFLLTEIHTQYVGGNKESDFLTLAFFPVCILFLYMLT